MKENDYINATDLGKITSLRATLKELSPKFSNVVYQEEFEQVEQILKYWQERAYKLINKDKTEKWFFKSLINKNTEE